MKLVCGFTIAYLHSKNKIQVERNLRVYILGRHIYFDDAFLIFKQGTHNDRIKELLNNLLLDASLKFHPNSFTIKSIRQLNQSSLTILDVAIFAKYLTMYTKVSIGEIWANYLTGIAKIHRSNQNRYY